MTRIIRLLLLTVEGQVPVPEQGWIVATYAPNPTRFALQQDLVEAG